MGPTIYADVPIPSALLNGQAPGYKRARSYINATTGLVEGDRTEMRLYNATGGAIVAGKCYLIAVDGDEETGPAVVALAADTATNRLLAVAVASVAAADFGWFAVRGWVDAAYHGTTDIAKDDYLKVVAATGTFSLVKEGTSQTNKSVAIASAAVTTDGELAGQNTKVYLLGLPFDPD